jgi:hypothetical protein
MWLAAVNVCFSVMLVCQNCVEAIIQFAFMHDAPRVKVRSQHAANHTAKRANVDTLAKDNPSRG